MKDNHKTDIEAHSDAQTEIVNWIRIIKPKKSDDPFEETLNCIIELYTLYTIEIELNSMAQRTGPASGT